MLLSGIWASALAQSPPATGEIGTEPGAHPKESSYVPLPPEGPQLEAFLASALRVDLSGAQVTAGGKPISAAEFYRRVDRPDLAARAEERTRQRIWLMSGGGVTALAGVIGGILVAASGPNTSSPECLAHGPDVYADCVDRSNRATTRGALLIGAGVALGGALITWGALTPEMVTSREETVQLVVRYNRALAERNGATGSRLELLPAIAPGYAGLVARMRF